MASCASSGSVSSSGSFRREDLPYEMYIQENLLPKRTLVRSNTLGPGQMKVPPKEPKLSPKRRVSSFEPFTLRSPAAKSLGLKQTSFNGTSSFKGKKVFEEEDDEEDVQWRRIVAHAQSVANPDELEQIERDLGRVKTQTLRWLFGPETFSEDYEEAILEAAKRILEAFAKRNGTNLSYVQGMHNIVLVLLSEFLDLPLVNTGEEASKYEEERCFWVFCALCENILGSRFFSRAPRLEGFKEAVETITLTVGSAKFSALGFADHGEGVIELVAQKWLLQMFADEQLIADVNVLKRIWDVIFLSANSLQSNTEDITSVLQRTATGAPRKPAATNFPIRLAVVLLKAVQVVAPPELSLAPSPTSSPRFGPRGPVSPGANRIRSNTLGQLSLEPQMISSRRLSSTAQASSLDTSRAQNSYMPLLHRRQSLQEMGSHATGVVMQAVLAQVRDTNPRYMEEFILAAENTTLVRPAGAKRDELLARERAQVEASNIESLGVLSYIKSISLPQDGVMLGYAAFKRLAVEACPDWTTRDVMDAFATLDVGRNGQVNTNFLLHQLPASFPDRKLEDLVELATAVKHHQDTSPKTRNIDPADVHVCPAMPHELEREQSCCIQ